MHELRPTVSNAFETLPVVQRGEYVDSWPAVKSETLVDTRYLLDSACTGHQSKDKKTLLSRQGSSASRKPLNGGHINIHKSLHIMYTFFHNTLGHYMS